MEQIRGIDSLVREHPFCQDLDEAAIALMSGCAKNEQFPAGSMIARENQPSERLFLLRYGTAALEIRRPGHDPLIIETLEAGEILGWSWIVPPYRWAYDVRAVTIVRAISVEAGCLRAKCDDDHSFGYEIYHRILRVMANRLSATRLRLVDLYAPPPRAARAP